MVRCVGRSYLRFGFRFGFKFGFEEVVPRTVPAASAEEDSDCDRAFTGGTAMKAASISKHDIRRGKNDAWQIFTSRASLIDRHRLCPEHMALSMNEAGNNARA
jgi:hypothetical protein